MEQEKAYKTGGGAWNYGQKTAYYAQDHEDSTTCRK
jgi:hypothetical protein